MKATITELRQELSKSFNGYHGHYRISVNIGGIEFSTTTTNMVAIDAAFDNDYNKEDNTKRYYESQEEAQDALISEVLRANGIEDEDVPAIARFQEIAERVNDEMDEELLYIEHDTIRSYDHDDNGNDIVVYAMRGAYIFSVTGYIQVFDTADEVVDYIIEWCAQ